MAANPLVSFKLYRPFKSPTGSTTYAVPKVTIQSVTVENYYVGVVPPASGKVFEFIRVPYPIITDDDKTGILDPVLESQILINLSKFSVIYGQGDGVFATTQLDNIIMTI